MMCINSIYLIQVLPSLNSNPGSATAYIIPNVNALRALTIGMSNAKYLAFEILKKY